MRRFLRRRSESDRQLKLIARADQRKADLIKDATSARGDGRNLRVRSVTDSSRIDKKQPTLAASRARIRIDSV
jgi:hypothetical protein